MELNLGTATKVTPDPYIIKIRDIYYIYTTNHNGIRLFSSPDLKKWVDHGYVITKDGYQNFWAPSTIVIDDVIYTYFSMRPLTSTDVHDQKIYVATAKDPLGPYTIKQSIVPSFSIDPHVVLSGNDLFMYYSCNIYEGERVGTIIVVDKMVSPTKMVGKPQVVLLPTIDEEIFMRNRFKEGQDWHTVEGAFYFREGNYHYLTYSGNSYENKFYFIGYAVAYGAEDDLTKLKFTKMPNPTTYAPLLATNENETSTGHNSVLFENGHYYIIYHGRDIVPDGQACPVRTARIASLTVHDGILSVNRNRKLEA